jgi:peptidoglycan DL-endopeptidase CwlO
MNTRVGRRNRVAVTRRIADIYGIVRSVHLTDGGIRRVIQTFRARGLRRMLPAAVAVVAALGALLGTGIAVLGGTPRGALGSAAAGGPARYAAGFPASFLLPKVRPTTGDTQVVPGFAPNAHLLAGNAVPAARVGSARPSVAPLRRTRQADLLIVAPRSLSHKLLTSLSRLSGVTATEQIEAVRMRINGSYTAVLGVDPSVFRSFAARPTATSNALWEGVAGGGIAVSYTMGKLDKLPLGGTVRAAGHKTERLRVVAFGTMGIGGVDAVVSHQVARSLGAPAGNAIVISASTTDLTAVTATAGRLVPHGASVEQLVTVVSTGAAGAGSGTASGMAGAGSALGTAVPATQLNKMLHAAMSRRGMPYIWGAAGPTSFDCSGLVQWSFAQAGVVMPRVAADQALTGPAVPVSQLQPGDLLFYHTDPTAPTYISHVAIYLGNGWMIQAPEPGKDVEVVPADFGNEFAGAVRVNPAQATAVAARVA